MSVFKILFEDRDNGKKYEYITEANKLLPDVEIKWKSYVDEKFGKDRKFKILRIEQGLKPITKY